LATPTIDKRLNRGSAYLKDRWRLWQSGFFDVSLRLSGNDVVKEFYLEPRLGMNWQFTSRASVSAAWGRYNQMPYIGYISGEYTSPDQQHSRSDQSSRGYSIQLRRLERSLIIARKIRLPILFVSLL